MKIPTLRGFWPRFRFKYFPVLMRRLVTVHPRTDIEPFGKSPGSVWRIPASKVNADSIVYGVGVANDTAFDEALIARYGCHVHGFDPTPAALKHGSSVEARQPKFHFHPVGLWNEDTTLKFFGETRPDQLIFSAVNLEGTSQFIECKVEKLSTIMGRLGHSHIDLFKLDVEGAEYTVLDNMLTEKIFPTVLAVEFDQPMPLGKTLAMVRRLVDEGGYELVDVDLWNYLFVRGK